MQKIHGLLELRPVLLWVLDLMLVYQDVELLNLLESVSQHVEAFTELVEMLLDVDELVN